MTDLEVQAENLEQAQESVSRLVQKLGPDCLALSFLEGGRSIEGFLTNAIVVNQRWERIFSSQGKDLLPNPVEPIGKPGTPQSLLRELERSTQSLRVRMTSLSSSELSQKISIPWLYQGKQTEMRRFLGRPAQNLFFALGQISVCGEIAGRLEKTPPLSP